MAHNFHNPHTERREDRRWGRVSAMLDRVIGANDGDDFRSIHATAPADASRMADDARNNATNARRAE